MIRSLQLPGVTREQCIQKWNNLRSHFMRYTEGTKSTGMGKLAKPVGYDILTSFLLQRLAVNPNTLSSGVPEPCHPAPCRPAPCCPKPCRPAPQPLSPATTRPSNPLTPVAVNAAGEEPAPQAGTSTGEAVAVSLAASAVRPAKRRRMRPLSWTDHVSNLIGDFQQEVREANSQVRDMLSGFMQESLQNQRRLCDEERRRTDLLEKLLEEMKKDK